MNNTLRKYKNTIIGCAILFCILIFLIIVLLSGRVSMNPEGTIGNTAGNLNNDGLFCEYNGTVYFSNSYDGGSLYAMDPSEGNIRKLSVSNVRNLLAGGKYLYYFQIGATGSGGIENVRTVKSFNRSSLDGDTATGLTRDVIVTAQLVDNYLYMLASTADGPSFYKIKIDKSDKTMLANYQINPACAVDGTIYYNGTQTDHYLYALNTTDDTVTELWKGNVWYPVVEGDYVYYLDVENDYRLCRYSFSQAVIEVLTDDRVDCFNVDYGYIYYQKNGATPQLKCMRTDGTDVMVIAEGNYTHINMTSQYVYFQEYGDDISLYHSPLGSNGFSSFQAAKSAAPEPKIEKE